MSNKQKREYYKDEVTAAFQRFASTKKTDEELTAAQINEGAKILISDGSLHGYCVSDYAKSDKLEYKNPPIKEIYKRIRRGVYVVL